MNGRLVWITGEEQLEAVMFGVPKALDELADAWDAAPSDPAEAIRVTLDESGYGPPLWRSDDLVSDVLSALGVPVEAKP